MGALPCHYPAIRGTLQQKAADSASPSIETITIDTLTSADPGCPCPEPANSLEGIPLNKGRHDHIIQLGREMDNDT